jgi:hypothetical protein
MKLQYGIDTDADGLLDPWVSATGPWAASALFAADAAKINQIKAVRIGVIVQGQQFDKSYNEDVPWSLFDGDTPAPSPSPRRRRATSGTARTRRRCRCAMRYGTSNDAAVRVRRCGASTRTSRGNSGAPYCSSR